MAIVGVAVRFQHEQGEVEVRLPKPNRHCDCFKYASEKLALPPSSHKGAHNQGFYDDGGTYLDRFQAWKHVAECGQQLIPDYETGEVIKSGPLFSEDVW